MDEFASRSLWVRPSQLDPSVVPLWDARLTRALKTDLCVWGGGSGGEGGCVLAAQSCLTLFGPADWSQPGSSVHKTLQERTLERVLRAEHSVEVSTCLLPAGWPLTTLCLCCPSKKQVLITSPDPGRCIDITVSSLYREARSHTAQSMLSRAHL